MELTVFQYVAAGLILLAGSVLQGMVGFASGLFGVPLLLMSGFTLPQSVTMVLLAAVVQTVAGSYQLRREIVLREVWRPSLIRLAALPLGIGTLWLFRSLDQQFVKQLVGVLLLLIVVVQGLWRVGPKDTLHPAWEWIAFASSGYMLGLCGMGGPPMALWVMAHDWTTARSRAFLFFVLMTGMLPQSLLLLWLFGSEVMEAGVLGLLGIPLVAAGTVLGLYLGQGLPRARWRGVTYVVLTLIALSAIVSPFWQRAAPRHDGPSGGASGAPAEAGRG